MKSPFLVAPVFSMLVFGLREMPIAAISQTSFAEYPVVNNG